MTRAILTLLLLLTAAPVLLSASCDGDDDSTADDDDSASDDDDSGCPEEDADCDGFVSTEAGGDDCDDSDPVVHPGAEEICGDGVDNDCDGMCVGCGPCGVVPLADADAKLIGGGGPSYVGRVLSHSPDLDGDGHSGGLVSWANADSALYPDVGTYAYVIDGPLAGTSQIADATQELAFPFLGNAEGVTVLSTGRFTAMEDHSLLAGGTCGWGAWVLPSTTNGIVDVSQAQSSLLPGPLFNDGTGHCNPTAAGDIDADGYDDVLISAYLPPGDDEHWNVLLYSGPFEGEVTWEQATARIHLDPADRDGSESAPDSLATAGDVNGDGFDDILIGDTRFVEGELEGVVYLFYGPLEGTLEASQADARIAGRRCTDVCWDCSLPSVSLGSVIAGASDTNGDGLDDIILGAPTSCHAYPWNADEGPSGEAYLFLGPVSGQLEASDADTLIVIPPTHGAVGKSVAGAGDVNGDGLADVVVGGRADPPMDGITGPIFGAWVFEGPIDSLVDLSLTATTFLKGEAGGDNAASALSFAGDDADGFDDILVGASAEDSTAPDMALGVAPT